MFSDSVIVVGGGNMGTAIVRTLLDFNLFEGSRIFVVDPKNNDLESSRLFFLSPQESKNLVEASSSSKCKVLIFAVKPQISDSIIPSYSSIIKDNGVVLSCMGGVKVAKIRNLLNNFTTPVVRFMPNLPMVIRKGVLAYLVDGSVEKSISKDLEYFFSISGSSFQVEDENMIDIFTAVSGSGTGYVAYIIEQFENAAISLGVSKEYAREVSIETFRGALDVMSSDGNLSESPEKLRKRVTSPNGTTQAGLEILKEFDLLKVFSKCMNAAFLRSKELGN